MVDDVIVETVSDTRGDLSQLEKDLTQAVASRKTGTVAKQAQQKLEASNDDEDLPAKLKGKSLKEVAEMYVNLESSYGRMANDLGTQRKLTDRILDLKRETDLGQNGGPAKVEIKSADLLENPTATLERFSEAREKQSEQRLAQMEMTLAAQTMMLQHPDYVEIAQSADFANWVQASPFRLRAARAAHAGDWATASDLLTEYKATAKKAPKVDDEEQSEDDARAAAKKAGLESGGQSSATTKKSSKIYRRADLMRLKAERPDVYEDPDFQREIILAYHEKRVR